MSQQPGLFPDLDPPDPADPAPWIQDSQQDRSVATIVFAEVPWGPFDYLIPDALHDLVQAGRRVEVPLGRGNRKVTGYCVEVRHESEPQQTPYPLKSIVGVKDDTTLLSAEMLELTRWIADHYLARYGQVLEAAVPAGVRTASGTREVRFYRLNPSRLEMIEIEKLPTKQQRIVELLRGVDHWLTADQICKRVHSSVAPIQSLVKKGLVQTEKKRVHQTDIQQEVLPREKALQLNADQQHAFDTIKTAIAQNTHETILIHGVTGSGKTEVYIQAIEEVIRYGRQAIVLVPEISLTPQTRQRFRSRFDKVAVLHSHLSDAERHWHWQQIAQGDVQVVVGARSAVFAPVARLGLIVLDEEHETTFKQETVPRYHARDVAQRRAALHNIPLILGSATPALETWHHAQTGKYQLVSMPDRVLKRPLPHVTTVDLRLESRSGSSRGSISRQLHSAMTETLRDDGQIILLLNRRGYSTRIQCPACGVVVQCPQCEIALTHHRFGIAGGRQELALCHYCDYQIPIPPVCPDCGGDRIHYGGLGTQKLEEEVRARFAGVPVLRMDSDTMQRPNAHEIALDRFRNGEIKILVGTQMIAKGLDFPNVTLVGVINADTALHFPDFRAGERTFQLVTQVAGRTGRGSQEGRVLVQTFTPEHLAIEAAIEHDFAQFAEKELPGREQFGYPPFCSMIRLIIRGPEEEATKKYAQHLATACQNQMDDSPKANIRLLGPAPAPIAKLRDKFRYHFLLLSQEDTELRRMVAEVYDRNPPPDSLQWIVDVDPQSLL